MRWGQKERTEEVTNPDKDKLLEQKLVLLSRNSVKHARGKTAKEKKDAYNNTVGMSYTRCYTAIVMSYSDSLLLW